MISYGVVKSQEEITVTDAVLRPKQSRKRYDSISPGHIPDIGVDMKLTKDSEQLSVTLPESVFSRIPLLQELPEQTHSLKARLDQDTGERIEPDGPSPSISLPGSLWHLLIVLKAVLEDELDGDAIFLDDADTSSLAMSLQVQSQQRRCKCMCNARNVHVSFFVRRATILGRLRPCGVPHTCHLENAPHICVTHGATTSLNSICRWRHTCSGKRARMPF